MEVGVDMGEVGKEDKCKKKYTIWDPQRINKTYYAFKNILNQ